MAIAFDASSSSHVATQTVTLAHTCTGSNLILLVAIQDQAANDLATNVTGVTYNGVSMTKITSVLVNGGGSQETLYLYGLLAPATGTNNIVVSRLAGAIDVITVGGSYSGVSQATAIGSLPLATGNSSGSRTSYSLSVTTVADNSWPVLAGVSRLGGESAGSATTMRGDLDWTYMVDSNAAITPAGSTTLNINQGSDLDAEAIVAIAPVSVPLAPFNKCPRQAVNRASTY